MANYKPVKIIFDLDDEYQKLLHEHLIKRSNKSAFIRTLLHQDISNSNMAQPKQIEYPKQNIEPPTNDKTETKSYRSPDVQRLVQTPVTVKVNVPMYQDDEVILDGLM